MAGLWRYPVKSAGGERLARIDVSTAGVAGDRVWAVVDRDDVIVSAKHPKRGGQLLRVSCRFEDASGQTTLNVPGVGDVIAGTAEADEALSGLLSRPVRLTRDPTAGRRLRRWWPSEPGLVPEWESGAVAAQDAITAVAGTRLRGSFVDYGAIHVVAADDLTRLSHVLGMDVDPVRFRPNVLVDRIDDLDAGAGAADAGVILRLELPTPRCAVPGLSPTDGTLEPELLHALARFDRRQVGSLGTAACFGVYAFATTEGAIGVGDTLTVTVA